MKTTRHFGRKTIATLGISAMIASGFAFTSFSPLSEAEQLAARVNDQAGGVTSIMSVKADTPDMIELLSDQFDLAEFRDGDWFHIVTYPGDIERLTALGFHEMEVVIADLIEFDIAQRLLENELAGKKGPTDLQPGERQEGYRTWADFDADVRQLAADNPDFVRLMELPNQTHEGRTVVGLQIAGNPDAASTDGRPSSVLMGLHHAREWPSAELTLMFAYDMIESYNNGDKEVVDTINNVNFLVIPVVNPDGYVRSRETVSDWVVPLPGAAAAAGEFAYHRKNMRPHASADGQGLIGQGVDPNRNYPYKWGGPGTSTSTGSATYHGPAPASEPEIENILDLLRTNHVTTLITNHTYTELVLRPFGDSMRDTPDEEIVRGHADAMAAINGYASIKGLELYATTGTTDDWVYGVTGAPSYTFEIGPTGVGGQQLATAPGTCGGFHGVYQLCVGDFYALNRDAYMLNLKQALNPAWHSQLNGTAPAGTVLNLVKDVEIPLSVMVDGDDYMSEHLEAEMIVGADGTFNWHVNPSPMPQTLLDIEDGFLRPGDEEKYTLTATAPDGTVTVIKDILVKRGTVHDFAF
ncbi:MAG: hypothetical protein ACI867_000431 [Glaciecola sp.]|jgi:hypothetical protein